MQNSRQAQPQAVALFVSDVHLQESLQKTTEAFLRFLREQTRSTQHLYLLGDLFEYWAGDDDLDSPYHRRITQTLQQLSQAGIRLFWIGGNRDFLVGDGFAKATGATLLDEPYVTELAKHKLVLCHGDAQCTDDLAYMAFRSQVRSTKWQTGFLAMPLARRKAIIEEMREQSRTATGSKSYDIMDVNKAAVEQLFNTTGTDIIIHGHTHRPACHAHDVDGRKCLRYVLPDWDCEAAVPRGGWLALHADGTFCSHDIRELL